MAKKEKETEKQKVTEDLTPNKDPKGGSISHTAANSPLANATTATSSTIAAPVARPTSPIRRRR